MPTAPQGHTVTVNGQQIDIPAWAVGTQYDIPETPTPTPDTAGGAVGYRNPVLRAESPLTLPGGLAVSDAPDLEKIRQDKLKAAQAQVDVISQLYDQEQRRTMEANTAQEGRTRALNISAGLAGSEFASTAAMDTEAKGKKALDALANERAAKISAILADAEDKASASYQQQRQQFLTEAGQANDYRKQQQDEARSSVTLLAENGTDLSKLKTSEPDIFKSLMERSGFKSDLEFDSFFNNAKKANDKLTYKDYYTQGPDGKAVLNRISFDTNGVYKGETKYNLEVPYSSVANADTKEIDGVLYERQGDGTWKAMTSQSPTAAADLQYKKLQIAKLAQDVANNGDTALKGVLSPLQTTALQAAGLKPKDYQQITLAILGGASLDDVRAAMRNDKINPALLDQYDRVVNIAGLLARTQYKVPKAGEDTNPFAAAPGAEPTPTPESDNPFAGQ
jgi:hypothetical protein